MIFLFLFFCIIIIIIFVLSSSLPQVASFPTTSIYKLQFLAKHI